MTLTPLSPPTATAETVLRAAEQANWCVLVGRGGTALALELAQLGKPLLVVEADPEQVEELQRQLAEEPTGALTVCCELLGSEAGETCWYRYNDPRRNGPMGPEAMPTHFPNLRLLSLELRPQRRLDALLSAWEERRKGLGDATLRGPGVLVGTGVEALPVLQGCGPWIERFETLYWAFSWLGAEAHAEAWEELLHQSCLRESNPPPPQQESPRWSVLHQHREDLLERKLHEALRHIANLSSERDSLANELDALRAERDGLAAQQQELSSQCDSLIQERDMLKTRQKTLETSRDELHQKVISQEEKLQAINAEPDQIFALLEQYPSADAEPELRPPS